MTLPLRKKRQITRPNTPEARAKVRSLGVAVRAAAAMAAVLFCAPSATIASEGWTAVGAAKSESQSRKATKRNYPVKQASATRRASKLEWRPVAGQPKKSPHPAQPTTARRPVRQAQLQSDPFEQRPPAQLDPFENDLPNRLDPDRGLGAPGLQPEPMPVPRGASPFQDEPPASGSGPGEIFVPESNDGDAAAAENRRRAEADCDTALEVLRAKTLSTIGLDIRMMGVEGEDFPAECEFGDEEFRGRHWHELTYAWHASGACHKPLYFEDVQLERYGHEHGHYLQPAVSALHFFGNLAILPWNMGLKTPDECVYALGHYRPGNCAPYYIDPIGATWRSVLFQGAAVAGVVTVIP